MKYVLPFLAAALMTCTISGTAKAEVNTMDPDKLAVEGILSKYRSPLPEWTILAFKQSHEDFDIAGYLTVMWCESSLGTNCGIATNNPGGIKGGPVGTVWRDLRVGVGKRGFNLYANMYDGQRAAIRLIYDKGYNAQLAAHDWTGFGNRYYGKGVPGLARYIRNLKAAHKILVAEAAKYGAIW